MGEELVTFLQNTSQLPDSEHKQQLNKVLAHKCLSMLLEDGDGRYALDYLGDVYRDMAKGIVQDFIPKAQSFLHDQVELIKKQKNAELFIRYHTLTEYFKDRIPLWENDVK